LAEFNEKSSIFIDVDRIGLAENFESVISNAILKSDIFILVIGPRWMDSVPGRGVRLFESEDPVRREIELAIEHGLAVVPVFFGNASMPSKSDLPEPIRQISLRNGVAVSDRAFRNDLLPLRNLIEDIKKTNQRKSIELIEQTGRSLNPYYSEEVQVDVSATDEARWFAEQGNMRSRELERINAKAILYLCGIVAIMSLLTYMVVSTK
jgi:hypothetical protein